jgi:hypothetical protein
VGVYEHKYRHPTPVCKNESHLVAGNIDGNHINMVTLKRDSACVGDQGWYHDVSGGGAPE